jgi:hypothetical protein
MKKLILLFTLFLALPSTAYSIDMGNAKGTLVLNGETIALNHAYAELHDNAEGLLDYPKELRILVTDRDVPQESLNGLVFLPVSGMAKNNQVRGLLIKMNPDDPDNINILVLAKPTQEGESLMSISRSGTTFTSFKFVSNRVQGEIQSSDKDAVTYSINFSAPVFNEPAITADLKDAKVQKSPQMMVLKNKIAATEKADLPALKALSSSHANAENAAFLSDPRAAEYLKQGATETKKSLSGKLRLVERGNHAVIIFQNKSYMNFAKENGVWKADD